MNGLAYSAVFLYSYCTIISISQITIYMYDRQWKNSIRSSLRVSTCFLYSSYNSPMVTLAQFFKVIVRQVVLSLLEALPQFFCGLRPSLSSCINHRDIRLRSWTLWGPDNLLQDSVFLQPLAIYWMMNKNLKHPEFPNLTQILTSPRKLCLYL